MTLSKNGKYIDHENDVSGVLDDYIRIRPAQRVYSGSGDTLLEIVSAQ
jgi:hypothetical protein